MNDAERRIITEFVERMAGAAPAPASQQGPWGGSVPATQSRPALPPVDREADALINDLFARHPEARYRITQTAFVQEAALVEAQNRIRQLEWEVQNAQAQAQQPKGMFGGLFGGGGAQRPMAPPPQPQYPPGYNPAMMQRGGPGFLGTALTTAAGVAGGLVLGNMLMSALSGGGTAQAAGMESGGGFGQEAVPTSSPWEQPSQASSFSDPGAGSAGGWGGGQDASGAYDDGGYDDAGGGYDEDV